MLSDRDIRRAIEQRQLIVDPPVIDRRIQPSSVDLRLDRWFRVFATSTHTHIDPSREQPGLTQVVEAGDGGFVLHPGQFVLGATFERVGLGDRLAGRLEGKSSLGRLGLLVHSTAGFIDAGFDGHITLELSNVAELPITLWPGMRIGQLCLFALSSRVSRPYGSGGVGSHYQGQVGPTPSRSWERFESFRHGEEAAAYTRAADSPRAAELK